MAAEIPPLERKRVEPGRMAAEFECVALGFGQQSLSDATSPQRGMHPEQVHEQPSGIAAADQPGLDRARIFRAFVTHEDAEIRIARIAQKRRVIDAETVIDELPVLPGWILLEAKPEPGR